MAYVKIIDTSLASSGDEYRIFCSNVKLSGKRAVDVKPYANADGPVAAQTLAYENVKYIISGIDWVNTTIGLNYTRLMNMYKTGYNGANKTLLYVYLGDNNTTPFPDMDGGTSGIPVILESFTMNMDAKESKDAYMPSLTMTFTETA